jgi:hypothetical protein
MLASTFSRRTLLLVSPPGEAKDGAREWQAQGSRMLTDDRATRRKRIAVRTIGIALALWLLWSFVAAIAGHAQDTGFRVKVLLVSGTDKRLEAKFATIPDDLRLICHGDPQGMFVGDFVKVEVKDNKFVIGKLQCGEMAWVH